MISLLAVRNPNLLLSLLIYPLPPTMAKKLSFTSFLYKTMTKPGRTRASSSSSVISSSTPPSHARPWPSCSSKKEAAPSYFTGSSSAISTTVPGPPGGGDAIEEATMRGLRSDRLFFEPTTTTSMLVTEAEAEAEAAFEGGVAVAVDSVDPYLDFKVSMEEMVAAHGGVKDWEWLEEMLGWYLRMNGKRTHGVIVGAFLDLLLGFVVSSSSSSSSSPSSSSFKVE